MSDCIEHEDCPVCGEEMERYQKRIDALERERAEAVAVANRERADTDKVVADRDRLRAQRDDLRRQVAEWEGVEGRCPVGHNKRFTAMLLGKPICVACERDEAVRDYECLVKVLNGRFPRRPDGSLPDWKVEDVLAENEALRKERAQLISDIAFLRACIDEESQARAEAEALVISHEGRIDALEARLQRVREALEREEYRMHAAGLGDVYTALLADLEGNDDAGPDLA